MNYHDRFFKLRHFINNVCSQGRTVNFIIINVSTVLNKGISRISKYPLFFFKALTTLCTEHLHESTQIVVKFS